MGCKKRHASLKIIVISVYCCTSGILRLTFYIVGSVLNQFMDMPKAAGCTVLLLESYVNTCTSGETCIRPENVCFQSISLCSIIHAASTEMLGRPGNKAKVQGVGASGLAEQA